MIHLLILAAAALHLQDPAGDAVGDGSLSPPTAPVYANTAAFDLQSVTLTSAKNLTVRVTLGALPDPGKLPNGFSSAIVEVYLDTAPGGSEQLLPGSGMAMAPKHGWEVALRATGDEAYAVEAHKSGSPASWPRLPVKVAVSGASIVLSTSLPRPEHAAVYAVTGVYDPFTKDGWRPLTSSPSPWAFSSSTQHVPVVDVLASGQRAQRREIDSGVLAPYRSRTYGIGWLFLMLAGVVLAAAGAIVRRRAAPRPASGDRRAASPSELQASSDLLPVSEGGLDRDAVAIEERFLDDAEEAELWPDAEASVARASAPIAGPSGPEAAGDDGAATAIEEGASDGPGSRAGEEREERRASLHAQASEATEEVREAEESGQTEEVREVGEVREAEESRTTARDRPSEEAEEDPEAEQDERRG